MIIASVQANFEIGNLSENLARIRHRLQIAAENGAKIIVFPECALSGYCFDSRDEAFGSALSLAPMDPLLQPVIDDCKNLGVFAVIGLLEKDEDRVFNSATCFGPEGIEGNYRKLHLPYLGVDRYVDPGDLPIEVFEIAGVRVGMHICYDGGFPEMCRAMSIQGADLVVLPTCWPPAADIFANHVMIARSLENQVYTLASGRSGGERGYEFIGHSSIVAPGGFLLASAGNAEDTIIYAEMDVNKARRKRVIRIPGIHEINRMADRRPEFYGELVKPNQAWPRFTPGGPVVDES
jgi:predicted amidohydrolase